MGLLDIFSRTRSHKESVVLIDIGTEAVTGAYAHYVEGTPPTIVYTHRVPLETRSGELSEQSMLRALKALVDTLIREGAPALVRVAGTGNARLILVSVDAPWQETTVRKELFEESEAFVFTRGRITERLEKTHTASTEKMLADESIIGTILNGYETRNPYGKKVHRASVIVLTSLIERRIASGILSILGHAYHTKDILPIAGSSLRYQVMRNVFPHERDAIVLDATSPELPAISLIRRGLFVSLVQTPLTSHTEEAWTEAVTSELTTMAKQYPLPRTIFLLVRESDMELYRKRVDALSFASLWLSDNPPKIVPVLQSNMASSVKQATVPPADITMLFMALFYQYRHRQLEESM